ncbi:MAG: hypothetical protein IJW79_10315 [Clostridia bacterium]|nr:hypothetical protein [Clostridia bacterium]
MYFEVFLEIFVGVFAFFGIFCFVKIVGLIWFGYDNVQVAVEIDSPDSVENVQKYIREADMTCFALGGREIVIIVKREYYTDELVKKLDGANLKYYIV